MMGAGNSEWSEGLSGLHKPMKYPRGLKHPKPGDFAELR